MRLYIITVCSGVVQSYIGLYMYVGPGEHVLHDMSAIIYGPLEFAIDYH